MISNPRVYIIAGNPGSGKDRLIRAIHDFKLYQTAIVPKHTTRKRRLNDGEEIICPKDIGYNIAKCDIRYNQFNNTYGIDTTIIWKGLAGKINQVVVVSHLGAITKLRNIFRELIVMIYTHSYLNADQYRVDELNYGNDKHYVDLRVDNYSESFEMYINNITKFDHVILNSELSEDLYDQLFRIFRVYNQHLRY
jgi:hypothetical protein